MDFKSAVVDAIYDVANEWLNKEQIEKLIEKPKTSDLGDYAFPTFVLAKELHKSPANIAEELTEKISKNNFEKVEANGPYINFYVDKSVLTNQTLSEILADKSNYGSDDYGKDRNIPIDMSSPNIAKPMSMGHLRSTVIGNSLAEIVRKIGFNPIKINHLGDWGTQFGKLIVAYKKWGNREDVEKDPINNLLKYYVKFHEEAEKDPSLDDEARSWFKRMEDGDEEALSIWKWFRDESLKEFNRIYDRLHITFDSYNGEAFYNDKMDSVVDELEAKGLLEESQGAEIVDLSEENLSPALIKKTDGATLYITRDLAAAIYRKDTYDFYKSLYVVGAEQKEHFQKLKLVLKKMGKDWADDIVHVDFGLITANGKKLSTRKGNVILLNEVLDDAVKLAKEQIDQKNPDLKNKDEVAEQVGVGAVVFHDLKNNRRESFDFNLEEVVRFEGETGPYVQYTNARALSILRKSGKDEIDTNAKLTITDENAWEIIRLLSSFSDKVKKAAKEYEPSVIAKYVLKLSKAFNKYYAKSRILQDDVELNARLALVKSTSIVLTEGLRLLGVAAPEEM